MIEGMEPVVVDEYGGLVTLMERGDLPNGLAARATDCEFFPGGVKSRGPFAAYLTSANGGSLTASPVNAIMTFPRNDGTRQRLLLHDNGTLQYEYPEGTCTTIETRLGVGQTMRGCVLANRAFMAFSDGRTPGTRPRWWNGTWFDPIGQEGPIYFAQCGTPNPSSGNATASLIYQRQTMLTFETRGGFVTLPSNSVVLNTPIATDDQYVFPNMYVAPANVVKARVALTTNLGGEFYSPASLVQQPPGQTSFTPVFDLTRSNFSDTELAQAGAMSHATMNSWPLPPCLGVEAYNSRLVAWGAFNYIPSLLFSSSTSVAEVPPRVLNLMSGLQNGTFTGGSQSGIPNGWAPAAAAAGGALVTQAAAPGVTLQGWQITGNGSDAERGALFAIILDRVIAFPLGERFRVRIRACRSASMTAGALVLDPGTGDPAVLIEHGDLTEEFQWFDRPLLMGSATLNVNMILSSFYDGLGGKLPNNATITVDEIQIYPELVPNLNSYLLFSEVNDFEKIDYQRGMYGVRPGDGQSIVNVHELRGTLYVFKERSLFAVNDNSNAPYAWEKASLMSDTVGCLSVHGVGRGDGWLVTATEAGVFVFAGGQPQKISQEIQPTWNTVNFSYRHKVWCTVDPDAQRIYVGAPLNDSTYVNALFVCDYVSGLETNPIASPGNGRKWSVWTPPSTPGFPCGARIDKDNGQRLFVVGGGISGSEGFVSSRNPALADYVGGNVLVAGQWGQSFDDFGGFTQNILATYETATIGLPEGRSFFGYVVAKMHGNGGDTGLELVRPDGSTTTRRERAIEVSPLHDVEWQTADIDTQIGLRFSNSVGGVFSMKRAAAFYKLSSVSKLRGY